MRTSLLAAALALPLVSAAQTAPEYQPNGEVVFRAGGVSVGASYDETRIVGPSVNLEESEGGSWIGDIGEDGVDLEISPKKITGVGVDLNIAHDKDKLTIRGNIQNRRVWLELGPKKITGRAGACSFDLTRSAPGVFAGNIGCSRGTQTPQTARAELRLTGTAATPNPPHPQFPLAIVTVVML